MHDPLVPLDGAMNFRDLGGYPTDDGGRVRTGRVYRSDSLALLSDADHARLRQRGLRLVIDLRRDREVEAAPSRLPPGVAAVRLPIADDTTADQPEIIEQVLSGEIAEIKVDFMVDVYVRMLDLHPRVFGLLFERLADPGNLPAVVHCTAGKDRTGVAAALLLSTLGVPEETIFDDYELTTRYRSRRRIDQLRPELASRGVDIDSLLPLFTAPREVIVQAWQHLCDTYGSPEDYLRGAAGVPEGVLDRLREELVTR